MYGDGRTALVIGAAGQDGSYLCEHLLADGYRVWGMVRSASADLALTPGVCSIYGDLTVPETVREVLRQTKPEEIYNVAAVTSPGGRWDTPDPAVLLDSTGTGVLHLLEAIRSECPEARLVHASSSAVYEPNRYGFYGAAKQLAHNLVRGYREGHDLWAANAILFSHTSVRQSASFLARRFCYEAALVAMRQKKYIQLGDARSCRSWGWAGDYTRAMMLAARMGKPYDGIVWDWEVRTVYYLAQVALDAAGMRGDPMRWLVADPDMLPGSTQGTPEQEVVPPPEAVVWGHWEASCSFEEMITDIVRHDLNVMRS